MDDGFEEIRALGCDSLIVGVTGNAFTGGHCPFQSCGANAVLIKPFLMEALEESWSSLGPLCNALIEEVWNSIAYLFIKTTAYQKLGYSRCHYTSHK
jgi:hypothetical protein